MQSATVSSDRLRQIAILISSVDAATGRQLLLHLPTQTAKQVRSMVANLGPVAAEERNKILADFQNSVSSQPASPSADSSQRTSPPPAAVSSSPHNQPPLAQHSTPPITDVEERPQWATLAPKALLEFVRAERPTIIAVVVSQLAPAVAVEILQQLPGETNREVLQRVAKLGDIDDDAIEQIDTYLNERFAEYHKTSVGREANQRRMDALLEAAPPALQDHWRSLLQGDDNSRLSASNSPENSLVETSTKDSAAAEFRHEGPSVNDLAEEVEDSFAPSADGATILTFPKQGVSPHTTPQDAAPQKPTSSPAINADNAIPSAHTPKQSARDRSLLQIEFERLLTLQPHDLATVLSSPPASTVLLALAGSTPAFMQRFYKMLLPEDARALRQQISQITSLKLSDIDEAQRQLVELMSHLQPISQAA